MRLLLGMLMVLHRASVDVGGEIHKMINIAHKGGSRNHMYNVGVATCTVTVICAHPIVVTSVPGFKPVMLRLVAL